MGNSFALTKLMSSKFPLVVILAEVAAQLRSRSMVLNLGWTPRDQNEEADALTNGDYTAFCPTKRVRFVVEEAPWLVLPRMMEVATSLYEDVQRHKAVRVGAVLQPPVAKKAKLSLRQRDPW